MKKTARQHRSADSRVPNLFPPSPRHSCKEVQMNRPQPRRVFLLTLAATGAALSTRAHAQAQVDEKDPQAAALGYVADAVSAGWDAGVAFGRAACICICVCGCGQAQHCGTQHSGPAAPRDPSLRLCPVCGCAGSAGYGQHHWGTASQISFRRMNQGVKGPL